MRSGESRLESLDLLHIYGARSAQIYTDSRRSLRRYVYSSTPFVTGDKLLRIAFTPALLGMYFKPSDPNDEGTFPVYTAWESYPQGDIDITVLVKIGNYVGPNPQKKASYHWHDEFYYIVFEPGKQKVGEPFWLAPFPPKETGDLTYFNASKGPFALQIMTFTSGPFISNCTINHTGDNCVFDEHPMLRMFKTLVLDGACISNANEGFDFGAPAISEFMTEETEVVLLDETSDTDVQLTNRPAFSFELFGVGCGSRDRVFNMTAPPVTSQPVDASAAFAGAKPLSPAARNDAFFVIGIFMMCCAGMVAARQMLQRRQATSRADYAEVKTRAPTVYQNPMLQYNIDDTTLRE